MTDGRNKLVIKIDDGEDTVTLGDGWNAGSTSDNTTTYISTDGNNITLEVTNNLIID
ncbi:hypothetical protein LL240_06840 [Oceanimonas baumannii]|uniref:hypothetical protein n=1 Tax=Oceanimonas baumannii TaxID=129578 RepID=UPI001D18CC33|nr:hypothetical protein [Oceanimonas baumannii]MCC4264168.1 hypothetical protein [Oceanimonas baumannii]